MLRGALIAGGFDLSGSAEPLTDEEVEQYRRPVSNLLSGLGGGLDWALTHANKAREPCTIWMLSDWEADFLAGALLRRARHVGWLAKVARQSESLVDAGDLRRVGFILGKRVGASGMFLQANGVGPWIR